MTAIKLHLMRFFLRTRPRNYISLSAGMVLLPCELFTVTLVLPMYTMKAIIAGNGGLLYHEHRCCSGRLPHHLDADITTVKYVMVAMKADNHNEGGTALYSLVERSGLLSQLWLVERSFSLAVS